MGFEADSKRLVLNHYGPRVVNNSFGGNLPSNGVIKSAMWDFTFDTLPTPGTTNAQHVIPAGAGIVAAFFIVDAQWDGSGGDTTLTVGLQQSDGTEIDNNGLFTDVNLDDPIIEDAADEGKVVVGNGDLINGPGIGAAGELIVAPDTADLTNGEARVIVEYIIAS